MQFIKIHNFTEKSTIAEVRAKDFNIKESLEIVQKDMNSMRNLAIEIRNLADEEGDFETVVIFEEYLAYYSKNLWFVNSMIK